jgi:polygalacturonase
MKPLLAACLLWLLGTTVAPAATITVTDCGAVGDGSTINTRAIQQAVDRVAQAGGGTVWIPSGVFLSGTLSLRSHVELHLEPGAILKGSPVLADYERNGRRVGLLYTEDALDVSITGPGSIDGNADSFMDARQAKKMSPQDTQYTRQREHFREVKSGLGDGPVVPLERPYQMIIFLHCRNVTVRDVVIQNSPFWTLHCADCDGVMVSGTRIHNSLMVGNNDGLDCTDCTNVLVTGCDIRTGDDALVFSGYAHHHELPGYRDLPGACQNVVVSNCLLVSRSCAIRIGG